MLAEILSLTNTRAPFDNDLKSFPKTSRDFVSKSFSADLLKSVILFSLSITNTASLIFSRTEEVRVLNLSYSVEIDFRFCAVKIILRTIIEIAARIKEIKINLLNILSSTFFISSSETPSLYMPSNSSSKTNLFTTS